MKKNISLCVIAEGDSKLERIKMLYDSIYPYIYSFHITANGGEDNESCDKLKKWCEDKDIQYTYLKWDDDYAKQRNFNFSQVPPETDFILWADSDDVIVGGEYLQEIAGIMTERGFDSMFFPYWYGCKFEGDPHPKNFRSIELTQMRERLLRPNSIVWKGRLHETPVPINGQNHKYSKVEFSKEADLVKGKYPVAWMHLSAYRGESEDIQNKRMKRNRRILELQLADERKAGQADPRTLLYLMKIYAEEDDPSILKNCIAMGEEYMSKSGWDAERALCTSLMSKCMGKMGNDQGAADFLHKAIAEYPHDPLLYLHLAKAYYNLQNYRAMKHWMNVALSLDIDEAQNNINNLLEMKLLSSELFLRYFLDVEKNPNKAWEAAKQLVELNPTENNKENELHLFDVKELNLASSNMHKYIGYLESIGKTDLIVKTIECMPKQMRDLPFAISLFNKYKEPKVWGEKEICYFANFSQNHFERWSPKSIERGIGGSETAVIRLAEEWTKMGYKVTVYGDPGRDEGEHNGVLYLPWFKFNSKDKFNIFIQWRSSYMAGRISCKRFYVDLHDIFYEYDHIKHIEAIDKILVKSAYHRSLAPKIPDHKFQIISNGI